MMVCKLILKMRIKESGHKIIDLKSPNDSSVRVLLTSLVCVMCVEWMCMCVHEDTK